ncbi:MAG: FkbM family methyltransferase [Acidobacteriota bacterium]
MNTDVDTGLLPRLATWYLRDFEFQRGKGAINRLLGRFLQITTREGVRLRLTNPLEYHQRMLLYDNEGYEPEVTSAISSVLKEGHTFFDVGANLGYYTLLASKKLGSSGLVHAFEPSPKQFEHLKLNARINGAANVFLNNIALAESSGDREMFLSLGWNQGTHSLGALDGPAETCRVQCVTIDEYVGMNGVQRIDAMKVDVEGAELLVFRGAEQTLRSLAVPVIFFEACEHHARAIGHSTAEVKSFLTQLGYDIFHLTLRSGLKPSAKNVDEEFANLVAIHSRTGESCRRSLEASSRRARPDEREPHSLANAQ